MTTTTIRLPPELKERVSRAAERAGTTPHGFILDAIERVTEIEDRRSAFYDLAERRYAEIVSTGKTIPWKDMRHYLEQRIAGKRPPHPKARALTR
ncbi:MAG: CopG family transcriptional regulator [Burkholderiales bacterium]